MRRILAGQQLYPAPSAGYVPDGYTPLYFAVSAAAASVLGQSYLPLRLVSLVASLACFAILGRLVQRETGNRGAGLAAAGLLAATYFATNTWFDLGRVDSLFLALSVAGLYAARWAGRTRGAIVAGLLLGAAFCTKQSALAEGVAVLVALAAGPRRRLAVPAAIAYAAVVGGSTLALGLASHGWYVYYVFEQMSQHALNPTAASQFWVSELLPTLAVALCAALLGARRMPFTLLAGCAALVAESFAARTQSGSNLNDLLPAYLAVAMLAGLAMGGRSPLPPSRAPGRLARARIAGTVPFAQIARWRAGPAGPWIPVAAGALVIAQIGLLASGFRLEPERSPPEPDSDRAVGEQFGWWRPRDCSAARSRSRPIRVSPSSPGCPPPKTRLRRRTSCALPTRAPRPSSWRAWRERWRRKSTARSSLSSTGTCGVSRPTCRSTTTSARRCRRTASCPSRSPRTPRPCIFPYGCRSGYGPRARPPSAADARVLGDPRMSDAGTP